MIEVGTYVRDNTNRIGVVCRITHDDDGYILWVCWGDSVTATPCFASNVKAIL